MRQRRVPDKCLAHFNHPEAFAQARAGTATTLAFTYDKAGNLREQKLSGTTAHRFTHDAWNRLVKVQHITNPGGPPTETVRPRGEYEYNGLSQRVVKRSDHNTRDSSNVLDEQRLMFYSAGWQLVEERIDDAWSSGHTTDRLVQHVWGMRYIDDAVLFREDAAANGSFENTYYHLTDHQFSTVAMIDSAANLIERVSYTPYGEARHHWKQDVDGDGDIDAADGTLATAANNQRIYQSGYNVHADFNRDGLINSTDTALTGSTYYDAAVSVGQISGSTVGNTIGYAGYIFNSEDGIYTVRFRNYDPILGRWLERDPTGYVDGMSLYQYVHGRPSNSRDPMGLDDDDWGGLAGVFRRWFWGGDDGEGLSRRRQIESAGALDPIVPNDPLTEFYQDQMAAEAAIAQVVRDLGQFYADVLETAVTNLAMYYGAGLVVRLVVVGGKTVAVIMTAAGRVVGQVVLGAASAVVVAAEVAQVAVRAAVPFILANWINSFWLGLAGGIADGFLQITPDDGIPVDVNPVPIIAGYEFGKVAGDALRDTCDSLDN